MTEPTLSIVIPALNEAGSIAGFLHALQRWRHAGVEIILVDGGSVDNTLQLADPFCDKVLTSETGRAHQMNRGAAEATGEIILFLHADTQLPQNLLTVLQAFRASSRQWGRFDVRLSGGRPVFRLIERMINWRSRLNGIATGDQAIFMYRSVFGNVGGYADIPLMEDVEISKRLRRISRPFCTAETVITSSRRWEQYGVWKTVFLMWRLRWKYFIGTPASRLVREYYRP